MSTSDQQALRAAIAEINKISDNTWKDSLSERKLAELEFHDQDRDEDLKASLSTEEKNKRYGNKKYYSATEASHAYVNKWIGREAKGKVFLDYACGNGDNALIAAKSGAALSLGFDISRVSVQNCYRRAAGQGLEQNTVFFQADAENTKLPKDCVDTIICSGMLHHLDLTYAFPELRRILRPGGKILAVEALNYNPAIKLYRKLTPAMRTEWEKAHILDLSDVRFASRFFSIGEIRYWHILGILAPHVGPAAPLLQGIDRVLERIPYMQRMSWMFTFELIKPPAA